jgi:hypothetical protein
MHELLDQSARPKQSAEASHDTVGKASRAGELEPQQHEPMFANAEWESVEEEKDQAVLPEPHATARIASQPQQAEPEQTAASVTPPSDAEPVHAGDNPDAKERIFGDSHHNAHAAPFESHHPHAEKHSPKFDKFNKRGIHSDHMTSHVAARPGAVVTEHGHKNGVFMLKHAHATRYIYVRHGSENVAQPFDVVDKADLAHGNYKAHHKAHDDKGRTKRLLLNAAMPRELVIDGKPEVCVLSWIDGMTAAWIKASDLEGNTSHLVHAVKSRASRWDPGRVASDPHELKKLSKRYVVRNDSVGQATPADKGSHNNPRVLAAGAKGGDNVEHYLNKDIRKPGFDADGKPIGKNVTRSIVALCMNLPEHGVPPLAVDTCTAGQSFFVMREASFHRRVPVFANGAHHANILQTWVFGNLAMRDAHGNLVPDPARRGWLPFRTLADAADLEVHDIEQRK